MINRKELKALSKEQLRGQWTIVVLITLAFGVIQYITSKITTVYESSILFFLFSLIISTTITIFGCNLYLKLTRGIKVKISDMFVRGETYLKAFGVSLLNELIMIPVIIVSLILVSIISFGVIAGLGMTQDFIIPSNLAHLTTSFNFEYIFKLFMIFLFILLIILIPIIILSLYL